MLALESTKRHASEWRCEDIPRTNSLREGHSSRVGSALQQPRGKETGGKANSACLPASAPCWEVHLLSCCFYCCHPSLTLNPVSSDFQHGLGSIGSPGILQGLGTRLGYLRYPDSRDRPATPFSASPACRWPLLESPTCL